MDRHRDYPALDDPRAEVHILDAGDFALNLKSNEIIRFTQDFMARQGRK